MRFDHHPKIASVKIALLLILFALPVYGSDHITVLTEQSWPLNYTVGGSNDEPILGYATELVHLLLAEAELSYDIQIGPWARAIKGIDSTPNVLVYSMARTARREDKYYWIGVIRPIQYRLFGLKKYKDTLPKTLEAAREFRVSVGRAGVVHDFLERKKFTNLVEVNSISRYVHMLIRERVDLVPYNELMFGLFAERLGFKKERFVSSVKLEGISTSIYIVLSKKSKPELADKLKTTWPENVNIIAVN